MLYPMELTLDDDEKVLNLAKALSSPIRIDINGTIISHRYHYFLDSLMYQFQGCVNYIFIRR